MRLLLDTHTLIWNYLEETKLSALADTLLADPANVILVSPATHWEFAIKLNLGKFILNVPFSQFIQEAIFDNGFAILPIEARHSEMLVGLPQHHKDPFDRMLVAQAMSEGIPILSADTALDDYPIRRIW